MHTVTASSVPDAELVARCRAGDDAAWRELVERFSRYVYAIAVQGFRLRDHDAEDVFQDVFARVYERLDQLRDDEAIRPWLAQLTRRVCLDRVRQAARVEVPEEELPVEDGDDAIARIDEAFDVHQLLIALPEHCREILDRFFARDESYRAIGEALGLPSGTIASRISRCLAKLREEYEGRSALPAPSGEKAMK
jgi:RNA polymerase sigma factor (sigma-70 family)